MLLIGNDGLTHPDPAEAAGRTFLPSSWTSEPKKGKGLSVHMCHGAALQCFCFKMIIRFSG